MCTDGAVAGYVEARAVGSGGRSEYLLREYTAAQCVGMRRGYLLDGALMSLCPETCGSLQGYEAIEARVECAR